MDTWIRGLYILTAIFGVGVTAIDMLGLFGNDSDTDADGDVGGGPDGGVLEQGFDADMADDIDFDTGDSADADASDAPDGGDLDQHHDHGPFAPQAGSGASLLTMLGYFRMLVYFSLGFGPVGLFALGTGSGELPSLLWAVPSGAAALVLARKVFQFQQRDVDSSVRHKDLFFAKATVTVPISAGQMGRVRVLLGQSTVDRYARAGKPEVAIAKGETVYIVRVTDECVYVERPSPKDLVSHKS